MHVSLSCNSMSVSQLFWTWYCQVSSQQNTPRHSLSWAPTPVDLKVFSLISHSELCLLSLWYSLTLSVCPSEQQEWKTTITYLHTATPFSPLFQNNVRTIRIFYSTDLSIFFPGDLKTSSSYMDILVHNYCRLHWSSVVSFEICLQWYAKHLSKIML